MLYPQYTLIGLEPPVALHRQKMLVLVCGVLKGVIPALYYGLLLTNSDNRGL